MSASAAVGPRPFSAVLHDFASAVGDQGPVTVVGGRTAWDAGGPVDPTAREVRAPSGIVELSPAEMVVRVGAGTAIAELEVALADHGQEVALGGRAGGTVGGAVVVGWSSLRRLGIGPSRDVVLEAACVGADGRLVRAGGPTVKNVTGYDLCRLLVGSLGTLLCIGEVLLRTRPRPETAVWVEVVEERPTPAIRPTVHLWDGQRRWLHFEGHAADVVPVVDALIRSGARAVEGPPELPPHRWSVDPARLGDLDRGDGAFVAEVGVGTVHHSVPPPERDVPPRIVALNDRMKALFDPDGRLNPGRSVLAR